MNNGLVSIIMPSYNTANYISESINSVINQSYKNWELIVVDDCSTDNTDEVIKDFLKDSRIKYLKNKENSGAAISRNKALRIAKGEWIAFLDSDDLWSHKKLEKQIKFMEQNNYNFSYTKYGEIDEQGNNLNIEISGPKKITKFGMYNYCWLGCLTVMYNREKIGLIQIKDIKKNNDYAMWLKICKKENCYLYPYSLALYRKRNGSISRQSYLKLIKWHYKLFREIDNRNILSSLILTMRNLSFGVIKKIFYRKQLKNGLNKV
jgi:glycosyltransferase involved in cell wall biosynthesis